MSDISKRLEEATSRVDVQWSEADLQRVYRKMSTRGLQQQKGRRVARISAAVGMVAVSAAVWIGSQRIQERAQTSVPEAASQQSDERVFRPAPNLSANEAVALPSETGIKRLLAFPPKISGTKGLDELCAHVGDIEASPFDGMIVPGVIRDFWNAGTSAQSLEGAAAPLRCLGRGRISETFLHIETAHPDWFDDARFDRVFKSAATLAAFLKDLPVRGVVLDTQAYVLKDGPFKAKLVGRTLAEAEAIVHERGRKLMEALQSGGRPIDVMFTIGYAEVLRRTCVEGQPLGESDLALLPAFLDGVLHAQAAIPANARPFVSDMFLPSYPTQQPEAFSVLRDLIHADWDSASSHWIPGITTYTFPIKDDPWTGARVWPTQPQSQCSESDRKKVTRSMAAGFGLMLDYEHDVRGGFALQPEEFKRNAATPEQFKETLNAAMDSSDRYVWIFASTLSLWPSASGETVQVPAAYLDAIKSVRR